MLCSLDTVAGEVEVHSRYLNVLHRKKARSMFQLTKIKVGAVHSIVANMTVAIGRIETKHITNILVTVMDRMKIMV